MSLENISLCYDDIDFIQHIGLGSKIARKRTLILITNHVGMAHINCEGKNTKVSIVLSSVFTKKNEQCTKVHPGFIFKGYFAYNFCHHNLPNNCVGLSACSVSFCTRL